MRYSNISIYIVQKVGYNLPVSCVEREIAEGVNRGVLEDGRAWSKDSFREPDELRDIVHAEDSGDVEIKSAAEMRVIMLQPIEVLER